LLHSRIDYTLSIHKYFELYVQPRLNFVSFNWIFMKKY
jgi:hypothetical protein